MSNEENTGSAVVSGFELAAAALPMLAEFGYAESTGEFPRKEKAEEQMETVIRDTAKEFDKRNWLDTAAFAACCAYAGIGCVCILKSGSGICCEKGVVDTLSEPRGFENMDEYVTDISGLGFTTRWGEELREHLCALTARVLEPLADTTEDDDTFGAQMQECFEAMYLVGVAIGMSLLRSI